MVGRRPQPRLMSDPEEEDDRMWIQVWGHGDGSTCEDEEEDDFFDAGQGTAGNRLSLRSASESCQSRGRHRGRSRWSCYTQRAPTIGGGGTISRKATTVDFLHTISSDLADLDNEEWVDPTPIPTTPLETATCVPTADHQYQVVQQR